MGFISCQTPFWSLACCASHHFCRRHDNATIHMVRFDFSVLLFCFILLYSQTLLSFKIHTRCCNHASIPSSSFYLYLVHDITLNVLLPLPFSSFAILFLIYSFFTCFYLWRSWNKRYWYWYWYWYFQLGTLSL